MVNNFRAEGLPLQGILSGFIQSTLTQTHGPGSHRGTGAIKGTHGNLEPGTLTCNSPKIR